MVKKSGKNRANYKKIGENRDFHIVTLRKNIKNFNYIVIGWVTKFYCTPAKDRLK